MELLTLLVGVVAAAGASVTLFVLARPVLRGRMAWPALSAGVAAALITVGLGMALQLASPGYLIALSAAAVPVLLLLEAAAVGSGADGFGRWALLLIWGVVVFPVVALVPLAVTLSCAAPDCVIEDFGGALPLLVSSSVFVLLAWLPAGVIPARDHVRHRDGRVLVITAGLWIAFAIWLASLEGVIDVYTPRILATAALVPATGAAGWLLVDRLRRVDRSLPDSIASGLLAGMVATVPGAVTVAFPWSIVVGVLAGVLGALVYSSPGARSAGRATRWGLTVFVAAGVGFLAPPISGDGIGLLFSAQASVLPLPVIAFAAVAVFGFVVSAPAWILLRRHASAERVPHDGIVAE